MTDVGFWAGFTVFAFVASITPGPNNLMLMASGANFGMRRTVPHMAGVVIGFGFLTLVVGLGLGGLFLAFPVLQEILRWGSAAFLLYLAWKIGTAGGVGSVAATKPRGFWEIVAFQWINPKAWIGAIVAIGAYAPKEDPLVAIVVISVLFAVVNIACVLIWTAGGLAVQRILHRPVALRAFNIGMALLLVLSLIPILTEGVSG